MHILIEGFDGTGKSTLARMVSIATGWKVFGYATRKPDSMRELDIMSSRAIQAGIHWPHLIQDRWPLVSNHCYDGETSLTRVAASLKIGRVDRIIHCDVDDVSDLVVKPRPGDEADRLHTINILPHAEEILENYRALMTELRALGFDVRRYTTRIKNG